VSDLGQRWLVTNPAKRDSTLERDQTIICRHVLPVLGSRRLDRVTRADIQQLVDTWTARYAASSVGRMHSVVHAMFAHARLAELIPRSPCEGIRLPKVELVERPSPDAAKLERLAQALGPDQAAMMWCGAVLGLRWGEAAGLQVGDLDVLGGAVHVRGQLNRSGQLGPLKTSSARHRLAVPTWLAAEFGALLARRGLDATRPEELAFASTAGTPLHYPNWNRPTWRPACTAAGLPGLRFHDLRFMAATVLVTSGVDVRTAQARLGHSSPQVTLGIYARMTADADRAAADAVGDFYRASRT
jgi:integrase